MDSSNEAGPAVFTSPSFRLARWSASLTLLALVTACGSGGGADGLGPLWVETDVKVADVDGDGRADVLTLATLGSYGNRQGHLLVYRQTAAGVFAAPLVTIVGAYPWHMVLADVDRDGRLDAVLTDPDSNATWLLTQDPARPGQFRTPARLFDASCGYGAAIADLDHDDLPDVAVPGCGSTLRIRFQDATVRGTFGPETNVPLPGSAGDHVAAADVDGDGLTDVLTWVYTSTGLPPQSGGLVVLFQQPGGSFVASDVLAPRTGLLVYRLAIDDANGDGRPDLMAFLRPSTADYRAQLLVVPQIGARVFGAPVATSLANVAGIDDAVFADLTGRGVPDAAVAGFWPESGGPYAPSIVRSRANLLFNDGSGAFTLSSTAEMPFAVAAIGAGDLDGDGRNDLVLLGGDNQCLLMYQSATPGAFLPPRAIR